MGIINLLDFKIANLIAAGEVVDRPASVIKELMENSIDAGALIIDVDIKDGGISMMRVTDNGKGMSPDDVSICVKRHATSKIKNAGDLDGILTLGFRGEALAAIASVCKLKIMTKPPDNDEGTLLISDSGDIQEVVSVGCPSGTTVICEELFANVPARRKFLKSDNAESAAVTAVVERIALSRPDIAIKYTVNGDLKFSTVGNGKLISAIYAVFGKEFSRKLINVLNITEGIEVTGFIGRPDNVRGNRNYQNFFINGRYVKSKTALAALEQACSSYIPSDKYPICILDIKIHPSYVDVNVHPAKLEVKFSNEKIVFNAVYFAVRSALADSIRRPNFVLNSDDDNETETNEAVQPKSEHSHVQRNFVNNKQFYQSAPAPYIEYEEEPKSADDTEPPELKIAEPPIVDETAEELITKVEETVHEPTVYEPAVHEPAKILPQYKIIGEMFYAYIIVELKDNALIIDKHAAHERIIFEDMKRTMYQNTDVISQVMLLPIDVKLNEQEITAIKEYESEIKKIGFDYEDSADGIRVYQIPNTINTETVAAMLEALASCLCENTGNATLTRDLIYEKALYQSACKAAVKAGHDENREHIRWIVENVLLLPNIKFCPHGRPVAFDLTKAQIERQFKRI
jgi:DNA mismatch repair protein MutL